MTLAPKPQPKRSLRWILALWFLFFSIVPVVFLTFYSLQNFQETVDNELMLRLQGNLSEIRMIISDYQKALSNQQQSHLKDLELSLGLSTKKRATLEEWLSSWLTSTPATTLAIYDQRGDLLVERSKAATSQGSNSSHTSRKKVSLHQNVLNQLGNVSPLWLTDFSNPQSLQLTLLSPVLRNGAVLGYLKQALLLDRQFLQRLSERMQIQAVLLEPNGRIIVGSHPDFSLYKSDFFADFSKNPQMKTMTLSLRGEPFGFFFANVNWGKTSFPLALAASKQASFQAIDKLRLAYYTLLAIMFVVLALSVLAASNIVLRPLSELIEAIQDLHLGENIIELPIKSDNEIGQLTTSFNDLSRRILFAQRALKDKISELEETNQHLKETQGQLVHSAKMASLGQLVAGVAHELNNPIGFIYANMTHLRDYSNKLLALIEAAEKDPKRLSSLKDEFDLEYIRKDMPKLISSCEEGARRTKDIVIGLRNFSRVEEKAHLPVDLHESLETTLSLLNSEFKNRIEIKRDYGPIPRVICNQTQINQVLMNILSNAAQAIQGPGTVWITTRLNEAKEGHPNTVSISIQDTGPGVAPELLQKIFDPFFTTKTVGQGTGLGLAISYGIISAHGGAIRVNSKLGSGTEFTVELPVSPTKSSGDEV